MHSARTNTYTHTGRKMMRNVCELFAIIRFVREWRLTRGVISRHYRRRTLRTHTLHHRCTDHIHTRASLNRRILTRFSPRRMRIFGWKRRIDAGNNERKRDVRREEGAAAEVRRFRLFFFCAFSRLLYFLHVSVDVLCCGHFGFSVVVVFFQNKQTNSRPVSQSIS